MKEKTLLICPFHNEEKTIVNFYNSLRQFYQRDVVFIDDGSSDKSRLLLEEIISLDKKRNFLLCHRRRQGYGAALLKGFNFALKHNYSFVVTMDVDLQHRALDIPSFLSQLRYSPVVLGSRYISIANIENIPRVRFLINRYIHNLFKLILGVNFTDPFCGFRGYRRDFLKYALLQEPGYGLAIEILLEIVKLRVNFSEIPVEAIYHNRERDFLDGLNDPKKRLLHYLEVIDRRIPYLKSVRCAFSFGIV